MTLAGGLASLFVVLAFACLGAAFGSRMLKWFGVPIDGGLERILFASGLFLACFQALIFTLSLFGFLNRPVVSTILAAAALFAGNEWKKVGRLVTAFIAKVRGSIREPFTLILILSILIFLGLDALLSTAPVAGSDAMLYHFAVPMLEVGKRWEPIFWLPYSFYTGQGHSLIQLGLTLGSERLATGSIFLAGGLTSAGLFVLVRRLASERWACVASLSFLLSPMVYWQMSTSSCPDIWIAFYVTLAVLAAARGIEARRWSFWFLAGVFAGAAAGEKYTSWIVPATVVLCCLVSTRSLRKGLQCGVCSLFAGAMPLARNAWWTGDPFFPFLTRWLNPANFNKHTYDSIFGVLPPPDSSHTLTGLIRYPLLLSLKQDSYGGFGHWYGPLVIALCPLLFFAGRKNPLWPVLGAMWAAILLTNELTAQQPRYLLSAFPLALALIFACAARAIKMNWRLIHVSVVASVVLSLLFGAASEAVYAKDFLPVVFGHESRERFLMRMAPEYPIASFVTNSLNGASGKAMVFFPFVYYLRVPFEIGSPEESWLVTPDQIQDAHSLQRFLQQRGIRWVVKAPNYPEPLTQAFQKLEDEGTLRPVFTEDTSTFSNFRMYGDRGHVRVVILEMVPGGR